MAITHADMRNIWREDDLLVRPPGDIAGIGLPTEAVHVLCDVGLPRHVDHYGFDVDTPRVFRPRTLPDQLCCQIGHDEGGDFSIVLASGHVLSCADESDLMTRFVNTTLSAFAESLHAAVSLRPRMLAAPDDEYDALFGVLEDRIRTIDPQTLRDVDSYWSVILEQMEIQLF
jgi:hypothetical protein